MYVCMYVYKYSVDIYLLCMMSFIVYDERLLPCGKLIGPFLFCLLLSILFLKLNVRNFFKD